MKNWVGKKYWLVGASEGLGEALAHVLSRAGAEVIVSARNADKLTEVVASLPAAARAVPMDISDAESVAKAARDVGEIDGVVLLAGVYWPMTAQNWDADQIVQMADVNFTGYLRVLGQVMPEMVARDAGHVVLTSSLSAFRGLPRAIGYGASKAAVLSLAESMHADLRDTGIEVQVANPGFIKTRMTDKNNFRMPAIMTPEAAAQEMFELMNSDAFKKSLPFSLSSVLRLSQFLPDWLYFRLFS